MSDDTIILNKIDPRFSFDEVDLPIMQSTVEDITRALEESVITCAATGKVDLTILRSRLRILILASARAQDEYRFVRDEMLPDLWTEVAFGR